MLTDFQNSFTGRLSDKFATKSNFTIPPHPCEIWMSENWRQSEMSIVINNKSQGSTVKHFKLWLVTSLQFYHAICSWKFFKKSVNIWWSYRQNGWLSYVQFALDFCHQRCRTRQTSKITSIWWPHWCHQWLTDCWPCTAFCGNIFFFVTAVVYSQ